MIWVFLGAPGAGKGTQARLLAKELGIAHVSTGDLLRAAVARDTEPGRRAREFMKAGELVPDALILDMVREALEGPAAHGCILDGYPRNEAQAEALDRLLADLGMRLRGVVDLEVPEETLIARISRRAAAESRGDDGEETVRNRLRVYREQTRPLVDFYRKRGMLRVVDGEGTIEEIRDRIRAAVGAGDGSAPGAKEAG